MASEEAVGLTLMLGGMITAHLTLVKTLHERGIIDRADVAAELRVQAAKLHSDTRWTVACAVLERIAAGIEAGETAPVFPS